MDTDSIHYRHCNDTVAIRYRYDIDTVSIQYRDCIGTVSILYQYCTDTVSTLGAVLCGLGAVLERSWGAPGAVLGLNIDSMREQA